jgi:PBP1b-binding outer membrane lipoprotein LpoB
MKKTFGVASAVLLTVALAGCGGDNGDGGGDSTSSNADYCSMLKDTKTAIDNLDFEKLDDKAFDTMQTKIHALEEAAPAEVKDDWQQLDQTFDKFKQTLDDAGLSMDDLQAMATSGSLPEGVDMQKLQEVGTKMQEFADNSDLEAASKNINEHAKSECNIDLDSTPATSSP